jgi:hypothetical protein
VILTLLRGSVFVVAALIGAYSAVRGVPPAAVPDVNGLLIALPAFFLWIPVSLLLSNVILYSVPPLRRIAEEYAARADQPGYVKAQKTLLKVLGVFALVCVPLIVLGFVL